ncbi:hypothetical protein V2J09_023320 [Rumex salicifolius]
MAAASLTITRLFLLLVLAAVRFQAITSETNSGDAVVLESLMSQWENTPPSWKNSPNDPCGIPWEGVTCNDDTRVTALKLTSMGLKGSLEGDIGGLTELRSLDLSFNKDLTGPLSPALGLLNKLNMLILAGCGFSGRIPQELGNLTQLLFLALNSNKFTGEIPASLGYLTNLTWLDLSDNQLTGPLPVSKGSSSPGLDNLTQIAHFHLNKNKLSGSIPPQMFRPEMTHLIHILLNGNQLNGNIPSTIGHIQSLAVLRLDKNNLTGEVPSNLSSLIHINEFNLANNQLTGPLPNLTGMDSLQSLDLSNNTFDESLIPDWFSTLRSLMTLVIENGPLMGILPETLFNLPQIQQVILKNNKLYGIDMGKSHSQQLQLVDLQHNMITSVTLDPSYKNTLILIDNPVCKSNSQRSAALHCQPQPDRKPCSTAIRTCSSTKCPEKDDKPSPRRCECAYPYQGTLYFNPSFNDLTDNCTRFQLLEKDMCIQLNLALGSILLENLHFNSYDELQMDITLFPSNERYFTRSQVQMIGSALSNHIYLPPSDLSFGPYIFIGDPYIIQGLEGNHGKSSLSLILGISITVSLMLVLVGLGIYMIWRRKQVGRSTRLNKAFASIGNESGGSLQLKGARWFSYQELKKGILSDGRLVAIKRAYERSMQGEIEFKTEVELLSRVHHKNVVGLIGFCFEQAERILVYEFLPNGSLKDSLLGKSGIFLDWRKRLQIALGSARGLAYLHELANPPIIHRDVKSTNILLDCHLNAKIADFGLSKLVPDGSMAHVSTGVKGTMGYVDPEYYLLQQLTEKSDVYSFGVVMLELLTAKQPIENGKHIVREVRTEIDKVNRDFHVLRGLLDPAIGSFITSLPEFGMYVELAIRCTEESAFDRPSMGEVVKAIEAILDYEGAATNSTVSTLSIFTDSSNVKDGEL